MKGKEVRFSSWPIGWPFGWETIQVGDQSLPLERFNWYIKLHSGQVLANISTFLMVYRLNFGIVMLNE